jgi:hypothetical protein
LYSPSESPRDIYRWILNTFCVSEAWSPRWENFSGQVLQDMFRSEGCQSGPRTGHERATNGPRPGREPRPIGALSLPGKCSGRQSWLSCSCDTVAYHLRSLVQPHFSLKYVLNACYFKSDLTRIHHRKANEEVSWTRIALICTSDV